MTIFIANPISSEFILPSNINFLDNANTLAFAANIQNCPKPIKNPEITASRINCFRQYSKIFIYISTAFFWKLKENIVLVFVTHSDKTPPASTLALTPNLFEPLFILRLNTADTIIKGIKQY